MASKSAPASPVMAVAAAPPTSPIDAMTVSARLRQGSLSQETVKLNYALALKTVVSGKQHFWCGTWQTGPEHPPEAIYITVRDPKNEAVNGALHKLKRGIPAKRVTSEYLMEGINKWCTEEKRTVLSPDVEEEFVKYVWHHMRQKQRDNAAALEAHKIQLGLEDAKYQLEGHYAEFPDERKTDDELVAIFRKLSVWSSVISSEQRRIASKKRHEKEERLIHDKFCGDRGAYNRWKALNEKVAHGRIRDVSPQLLVKFAQWLEAHPDYLYPGSRCIAVESAKYSLDAGNPMRDYASVTMTHDDVSKEHMFSAIGSIMEGLSSGSITVTLKLERSPQQYTMTDKYPLLVMHGCQRLISGSEHPIVAINGDNLVFKETTGIIKRLPDEFHAQLSGHCEREGMFKEITCRKVFSYTPGMVSSVYCYGRTYHGDKFHIRLRLTGASGKIFLLQDLHMKNQLNFLESLKKEAAEKRGRRNAETRSTVFTTNKQRETAKRMSSIRGPVPPSPTSSPHKNMARELIELGKMFRDGLLNKDEFMKAKADLL